MQKKVHLSVYLSGEFFLYVLLPPIIFAGGFTLKKRRFFKNFPYIILFGIFGTICNFLILVLANFFLKDMINQNTVNTLIFSATLCSTDSVASLTLINKDEYPKLFSIIFGEGMVNDAVSVILFYSVIGFLGKQNLSYYYLSIIFFFFLFY